MQMCLSCYQVHGLWRRISVYDIAIRLLDCGQRNVLIMDKWDEEGKLVEELE